MYGMEGQRVVGREAVGEYQNRQEAFPKCASLVHLPPHLNQSVAELVIK